MAWNEARIQLVSGVGNGNIIVPTAQILCAIAIPIQAALTSGESDIVISHLLPDLAQTAFPILTLTNPTLPYSEIPMDTPVNGAGVAQTNFVYQVVQSLNVSVVGGVGSGIASVWILLTD